MQSKRPEWEVHVYGEPLNEIDVDLMAQIVVILARELMNEPDPDPTSDSPS